MRQLADKNDEFGVARAWFLLGPRIGLPVGQLAGLLGVAIFLWQNALLVVATRQHYRISTERAVASVIGPIGGVLVLALALIILAITLAIIAQQPA